VSLNKEMKDGQTLSESVRFLISTTTFYYSDHLHCTTESFISNLECSCLNVGYNNGFDVSYIIGASNNVMSINSNQSLFVNRVPEQMCSSKSLLLNKQLRNFNSYPQKGLKKRLIFPCLKYESGKNVYKIE
jgi:hypothetical protein